MSRTNTYSVNIIQPQDQVWSAVFYLGYPQDIDLPQVLEQWPNAKYILYKTYMSNYGENLMGYVQFSRKMTGEQLAYLHHRIVWKHQQGSNYSCIRYIKDRNNEKIVRGLVELGEHWPFRPLPQLQETQDNQEEDKAPAYTLLQK